MSDIDQKRQAAREHRMALKLHKCKYFNGYWGPGMTEHPCLAGVD